MVPNRNRLEFFLHLYTNWAKQVENYNNNIVIIHYTVLNCFSSVILVIIENQSMNICDQRFHQFEIARQKPEVKVIVKTLTQMSNEATLSDSKGLLV